MRIEPDITTWVLIPRGRPHLIEVKPGTVFSSPGAERETFTDQDAAIAALKTCPPPFPSWILDPEKMTYRPPIPEPTSGSWEWDDYEFEWREVS